MESNRACMEPIGRSPPRRPMPGPAAAGSTAPAAAGSTAPAAPAASRSGESGSLLGMQVEVSVERD
jgi:hypothetical protein